MIFVLEVGEKTVIEFDVADELLEMGRGKVTSEVLLKFLLGEITKGFVGVNAEERAQIDVDDEEHTFDHADPFFLIRQR